MEKMIYRLIDNETNRWFLSLTECLFVGLCWFKLMRMISKSIRRVKPCVIDGVLSVSSASTAR